MRGWRSPRSAAHEFGPWVETLHLGYWQRFTKTAVVFSAARVIIMAEQTVSRTVVIPNRQGLHARPADQFVKLANQFSSQIEIQRETLKVNGKSILDLLTLAAEQGTELILHATGDDATEAAEALAGLVESFSEHDLEGEEDA